MKHYNVEIVTDSTYHDTKFGCDAIVHFVTFRDKREHPRDDPDVYNDFFSSQPPDPFCYSKIEEYAAEDNRRYELRKQWNRDILDTLGIQYGVVSHTGHEFFTAIEITGSGMMKDGMKLDNGFKKELKQLGVDREFRLRALKCSRDLATPTNMSGNYDSCIRKYGRATVAVCTAATIIPSYELADESKEWARLVFNTWGGSIVGLAFNDGLNPTRIMEYSRSLRDLTVA